VLSVSRWCLLSNREIGFVSTSPPPTASAGPWKYRKPGVFTPTPPTQPPASAIRAPVVSTRMCAPLGMNRCPVLPIAIEIFVLHSSYPPRAVRQVRNWEIPPRTALPGGKLNPKHRPERSREIWQDEADTPPSRKSQPHQHPSAFICGSPSFRRHLPPQSRIVLAFENPPDVVGAVLGFVDEVPTCVEEGGGGLHSRCGAACSAITPGDT